MSDDAARAYEAIWEMPRAGAEAIAFLKPRLLAAAPPVPERVGRLIADLDSEDVGVRDNAFEELRRIGEEAETALGRALEGSPSMEVRSRLTALIDALRGPLVRSPAALRRMRAVEVLERIGSAEAADALKSLASQSVSSRERREAQAALRRLKR